MAAGVVVAALFVVDFRLTGEPGRQALMVALTAVLIATAVSMTSLLVVRLTRPSVRGVQRLLGEEPDLGASDEEFFAPVRRLFLIGVLTTLVSVLTVVALYPLALWAGVRICAAVGLPAQLTGLWPVFVSGLVVATVAKTAQIFFALFRGRTRRRAAVRWLAAVVLNAAGLALAVLLLDGVRLEAAPAWRQSVTLCAVVCLFMLPRVTLSLPVPGAASLVLVAYHCLILWLICQVLPLTEPRLSIEGFWQLAGAAAIMWAVEWPARLATRHAQAATQPPPALPDPFPPDHMFPSGPLY
ncbi:hypothetical protein ABZX75_28725 [Streptomyces sp. NPDC003038]|uniref:hypothetical protein n=1 Tax=unclassified Streptomyces TaxID=2593676 RepID=UPI0033B93633